MDIGDSTISIYILIFVMGGGFLAGFVDAIAGGGGLISLPVLLATGMPPHLAIGTNKFSATFGAVMSAWQFWRAGKVDVHLMKRTLPCTFVGAVLGCACMLHLSAQWLQPIIIAAWWRRFSCFQPGKLYGSGQYVSGRDEEEPGLSHGRSRRYRILRRFHRSRHGNLSHRGLCFPGFDFIIAAGNAKVLNLMSNLTSFVLLVYWGKILYIYGAAMAVCLFAGAYFGSRLAIRRGTAFVRAIMLVVTTVLIVKLALDYAGLL